MHVTQESDYQNEAIGMRCKELNFCDFLVSFVIALRTKSSVLRRTKEFTPCCFTWHSTTSCSWYNVNTMSHYNWLDAIPRISFIERAGWRGGNRGRCRSLGLGFWGWFWDWFQKWFWWHFYFIDLTFF